MGEESGYRYDYNAIASARFVIAPVCFISPYSIFVPPAHALSPPRQPDLSAPAPPLDANARAATPAEDTLPTKKIKPFISKLAYALEHPELYGDVIRWGDDTGIFVLAQQNNRLVSNLLPELFGHKNSASFVRTSHLSSSLLHA